MVRGKLMQHNLFKIVRIDKGKVDDYEKSNKWARNKMKVLTKKEVKRALELTEEK